LRRGREVESFRFWESEGGKPAVSSNAVGKPWLAAVLRKSGWSWINAASLSRNGEELSESAWRKRFSAELHCAPEFSTALE